MAGEKDVVELDVPPAPPVELDGVSPVAIREGSIARADEDETLNGDAQSSHPRRQGDDLA